MRNEHPHKFLFLLIGFMLFTLSIKAASGKISENVNKKLERLDSVSENNSEIAGLDRDSLIQVAEQISFDPSADLYFEAYLRLLKKATLYFALDSTAKSLNLLSLGIQNMDSKRHNLEMAYFHNVKGIFLENKNLFAEATANYLQAVKIYKSLEIKDKLKEVYQRMGYLNYSVQNNEIALSYFLQAKNLILSSEKPLSHYDSVSLKGIWNTLGLIYKRQGTYDSALIAHDKSHKYAEMLQDTFWMYLADGNKGQVLIETEKLDEALKYIQNDYNESLRRGYYQSAFNAGVLRLKIHIKRNEFDKAEAIQQELEEILDSQNFESDLALAYYFKALAILNEKTNRLEESILYYNKYVDLIDSIQSDEKKEKVATLERRYRLERELSQYEILQKTHKLQERHLTQRTVFLVVISLALLLMAYYLIKLRNKNKKIDRLNNLLEEKVSDRTTKLMEINKELDTYLYRASHDIRRPIRTLLGLEHISKLTNTKEEMDKLFDKVSETARGMDKMLFKLQMAYELSNPHEKEIIDISKLVEECTDALQIDIEKSNAVITTDIPNKFREIEGSFELFKIALTNIIENALLYQNEETPTIHIKTDQGKYFFYILIEDNGYGIADEYKEKVFDAYFKISNKTQGSGLGLFLAQKAVGFFSGEISVESKVNSGSTFIIKLPINPK